MFFTEDRGRKKTCRCQLKKKRSFLEVTSYPDPWLTKQEIWVRDNPRGDTACNVPSCGSLFHCLLEKSLRRSAQEKVYFFTVYKQSVHECSIQFLIFLLTFQATLQRLEGMLEMPSQQEFMQMTSVRNGGDHVNGHGNVQGW